MGKQVKTPRFYVDMPTFLHATGQLGWDDNLGGAELLYMNCANPYIREAENQSKLFQIGNQTNNVAKTSFPINFMALLNHNLASDIGPTPRARTESASKHLSESQYDRQNVINSEFVAGVGLPIIQPQYNGTSIFTFSDTNGLQDYWTSFDLTWQDSNYDTNINHQLGSMVVGKYFDCPNSPDLNLTMSRRFDGIKRQKTVGGKTLANIYYDGPTEWTMNSPRGTYKYPPFELDFASTYSDDSIMQQLQFEQTAKSGLGRKGLRSWKLTFSYISEDNMWMAYENSSRAPFEYVETGTNAITNTAIPTDDGEEVSFVANPMLSDNSFNFVWNCTLGGTLPFIFQPDNTNNNPDQFSICNFRENSLSVQQVAFNTYKVSMTIDEIA
jgi:hypothetical protein